MFHPATNRLAKFLEISALSISLAPSGGWQAKAGYLYIEAIEHKGWGRKNAGWKAKREARWCAIRESYLVALVEPGEVHSDQVDGLIYADQHHLAGCLGRVSAGFRLQD